MTGSEAVLSEEKRLEHFRILRRRNGTHLDIASIVAAEPQWEEIGRQRLRGGIYFPGFFVFLVRTLG